MRHTGIFGIRRGATWAEYLIALFAIGAMALIVVAAFGRRSPGDPGEDPASAEGFVRADSLLVAQAREAKRVDSLVAADAPRRALAEQRSARAAAAAERIRVRLTRVADSVAPLEQSRARRAPGELRPVPAVDWRAAYRLASERADSLESARAGDSVVIASLRWELGLRLAERDHWQRRADGVSQELARIRARTARLEPRCTLPVVGVPCPGRRASATASAIAGGVLGAIAAR